MDAKTFTDLLKAPKVITGEQLNDLDEIIRANPYCKSASLLYLAGLHQHDNKKYTEKLAQFILFGKDKRMLHWIIDSLNEEIEPKAKVKVKKTPEKAILKKEEKKPVKEPEKEAKKEIEKDEISASAKLKAIVDKRLAEINKTKSEEEKKPEKESEAKPEKAPEKPSAEAQVTETVTKEEKLGKGKLIDKFIEEEPSISKPDGDYKHNIDVANKSSRDDSSVTSETLAQIHLNQGNKKRAIEIYEKLSLKNPEKSGYFAALIEKINKKSK